MALLATATVRFKTAGSQSDSNPGNCCAQASYYLMKHKPFIFPWVRWICWHLPPPLTTHTHTQTPSYSQLLASFQLPLPPPLRHTTWNTNVKAWLETLYLQGSWSSNGLVCLRLFPTGCVRYSPCVMKVSRCRPVSVRAALFAFGSDHLLLSPLLRSDRWLHSLSLPLP